MRGEPHLIARVGGLRVGVPIAWVHEALGLRLPLVALPRHAGAVAGLMDTARGPLPVIELGRWVHLPETPEMAGADDPQQAMDPAVLVLGQAGRSIGVQVDSLEGVRRIDGSQIRQVHHQPQPEELFEQAATLPGEAAICLLEPRRLMDLSAVWLEACELPAVAQTTATLAQAKSADAGEHCLRFRVGSRELAVPSTLVAELLPLPPLRTRWPGTGATLGVAPWRGRQVALLDLNRLLDGRPRGADLPPLGLVLRDAQDRALMLPIDELLQLNRMPPDALAPEAGASPWLGLRWLGAEQQECQRLRAEALLADLPEAGLGASPTAAAGPAALRQTRQPYLVFEAGQLYAAAISDIHAVLPRPPTRADAADIDLLDWCGRAIPIRPLAVAGPGRRGELFLVVGEGARAQALPVERLLALVPSQAAELSPLPGGRGATMLSVSAPAASYRVLSRAELLGPG